jgi:hypothetical protein
MSRPFGSTTPLKRTRNENHAKTQSVDTGPAHKLKWDESARVAPLTWRATSRNAINDHCEFEIGFKRTI